MGKSKALSVQKIRKAARKAEKAEPGLDAMWASAGWLVPTQGLALAVAGFGVWASAGVAIATTIGLALLGPFVAGIVEAFTPKPNSDRVAWVLMIGLASVGWFYAAGPIAAVGLAVVAVPLFLYHQRRYSSREASKAHAGKLPAALAERIVALPGDIPKTLCERVDRALASIESLHALRGDLPDGAPLWRDAIACTERVVDRAQAAARLYALPQQSPEIDNSKHVVEQQIDALNEQLSAAVDAASRFTALERDDGQELTERTESLHALVEATQEVEDALR